MRTMMIAAACAALAMGATASPRQTLPMDEGWDFAFGDAASPERDFGCGTEYFTYMAKAASIHNEGPYSPKFDPSRWDKEWRRVDLPHDWVVDLPFDSLASHSHGYKTVGYKYPETSVGWYRKTFDVDSADYGRRFTLRFDGIFRDSKVWVNGFFLGNEPSGYAEQVYDITEYLNYGGDNLVCVRADASVEEGWFYEGAGIYRHVWLDITDPLLVAHNGTAVTADLSAACDTAVVTVRTKVSNADTSKRHYTLRHRLLAPDGTVAATSKEGSHAALPKQDVTTEARMTVISPTLWDLDNPALYTLVTEVLSDGKVTDTYTTRTGLRKAEFDPDRGFLLNGNPVKLKGVNMHQDHSGVGAAIPDDLHLYRLKKLKELGINAYRSSHNPASPAVLDICDSLGILVIDENRLTGVNDYHTDLLRRMIERDRNHPSVILYSVGNEEWGIEWNDFGRRIVETMRDYCHLYDPSRPMTVASSSGPTVLVPADVAGYNYILQNPVDRHRADYPQRCALGSEETSGCGTRGVYHDDRANGRMAALNRAPNGPDSIMNCIERGWKFYAERPWLAGLFYWTGFDYRGEANPLVYPATGSEYGILDYCGFPKDEAYYLRSWWTDEPTLHIFPYWNLQGHEGEEVSVWAYTNCDEVELTANGRRLGRKAVPENGHVEWTATYQPGSLRATGYKNGRKVMERRIDTTGAPAAVKVEEDFSTDRLGVYTVSVVDSRGRVVPDACVDVVVEAAPGTAILGTGNGDPRFLGRERPENASDSTFRMTTFNGLAQVIVQGTPQAPKVTLAD